MNLQARRRLNPVLGRELRERVRTPRAAIILMVYLLVLTGILKLTVDAMTQVSGLVACVGPNCPPSPVLSGSLGRPIVHWLLFFSLILVHFIVPALTAGSITGERERQTLVPLQVTLLTPGAIVRGKLLASTAFIGLLVVATLPLLSTAFWVGGVAIGEVVKGTLMVLATAVMLAALGIFASAHVRGSRQATAVAYGLAFVLAVGTIAVYGMQAFQANQSGDQASIVALVPNPFVATADVLSGQVGAGERFPTPFSSIKGWLVMSQQRHGTFSSQGGPVQGSPWPIPLWIWSLVIYVGVGYVALWLAARQLRTPKDRL